MCQQWCFLKLSASVFSDCIIAFGPAICHFQTYSSIEVTVKAQDKSVGCSYSVTKRCLTLRSHGLQHARLPCLLTISWSLPKLMSIESVMPSNLSSSVIPVSSCPQAFRASRSFPVSRILASGNQIIGASASALDLPMNIHGWFPLGLTKVLSPCYPRDSQESTLTPQFKSINSFILSLL